MFYSFTFRSTIISHTIVNCPDIDVTIAPLNIVNNLFLYTLVYCKSRVYNDGSGNIELSSFYNYLSIDAPCSNNVWVSWVESETVNILRSLKHKLRMYGVREAPNQDEGRSHEYPGSNVDSVVILQFLCVRHSHNTCHSALLTSVLFRYSLHNYHHKRIITITACNPVS